MMDQNFALLGFISSLPLALIAISVIAVRYYRAGHTEEDESEADSEADSEVNADEGNVLRRRKVRVRKTPLTRVIYDDE